MKKELLAFIEENNLSPFTSERLNIKSNSIYKTKEAKEIHTKVMDKISSNFIFYSSSKLLSCFPFTDSKNEIKKRQEFVSSIPKEIDNKFLKELSIPKNNWKPEYDIIVVTESDKTFMKLKEMNIPVQLLNSEREILEFESRDLIQVIDVEQFSSLLEQLPQSVFLSSINDVYLERFLEKLSGWKKNLNLLKEKNSFPEIKPLVEELLEYLRLIDKNSIKTISKNEVESSIEKINEEISEKFKLASISGESLINILRKGTLPSELQKIIEETISKYDIPFQVLNRQYPVSIDEEEFDKILQRQNAEKFSSTSQQMSKFSSQLKTIPLKIKQLQAELIYYDFISGISKFISYSLHYPNIDEHINLENIENIFLDSPQAISFSLHDEIRCSILTGANSGGKTTLLEHIIQTITLKQLGFPLKGKVTMPLFTEVYYFAKTKGSASKGAFETLLTQMSEITPGNKTLILADEIEAVTEPGVAGKIVAATSEYFINKGCYLVIATHLGHEIQKILPPKTRIDGIEAKGLDENFELIIDHNPVQGRLAHSTPELIIEKMANTQNKDYFRFVNEYIKKN
ncbi:hypothetical protein COU57_01710 [Candidatus Pacearchaeota archaeon CG10_big_fil_rev_8_21_14_0_10_32_14]|nr:MAG: hypothetical protein COU57_01710 [Candidatus Pacearchaeota archaeon CG10_big_fil_rev_8_21_14_0_10_32_14]